MRGGDDDKRRSFRSGLIISIATITAVMTAVLAMFQKTIGQGLALVLGYAILFLSAVLINLFLIGSTSDMRRMALLVLTIGILVFFILGIIQLHFSQRGEIAAALGGTAAVETLPSGTASSIPADEEGGMSTAEGWDITPSSQEEFPSDGSYVGTAESIPSTSFMPRFIASSALCVIIVALSGILLNLFSEGVPGAMRIISLIVSLGVLSFVTGAIIYILFMQHRPPGETIRSVIPVEEVYQEGIFSEEEPPVVIVEEEEPVIMPPEEEEPLIPVQEEPVEAIEIVEEAVPVIEETPAEEPVSMPEEPAEQREETLSIPTAPTMMTIIESVDHPVPSAPDVFATVRSITEDEKPVAVPVVEEVEERVPAEEVEYYEVPDWMTDDFWSTFYIAGEEELLLADGIYYMELYVNGTDYGSITTLVEDNKASLLSSELRSYLDGTLTDAAFNRVFLNRGEYISLAELEEIGVDTRFDSAAYIVELGFDLADMPVQILSLRGSSSRYVYRPLADGLDLEPAVFSLTSRYTLNANFNDVVAPDPFDTLRFSLSSSNTARLYDVFLDFSYGMYFTFDSYRFNFGTYRFYVDFPEKMLRLSWGDVNSYLLSPNGTSIGVSIEKSTAYSNQFISRSNNVQQLVVIEKRSDVEVFNEGNSIFRRTLDPGTYNLRDFILYSGANRIVIRVSPLDGSEPQEIELDVLYSSALLMPGEFYYGASAVTSRTRSSAGAARYPGMLSIPLWNNQRIDYDFRDVTLSGYFRTGLVDTLTMDMSLAVQNRPSGNTAWKPNASLALELTNLTPIGTTRYNIDVDEESDDNGAFTLPSLDLRIGHQISFDNRAFSSLTFGAGYSSPYMWDWSNGDNLSLNVSMSGSFGILGWSLSSYGNMSFHDTEDIGYSWNVSASASFSFTRSFYMSASASLSGADGISPQFTGRVSATMRFGKVNMNASTSGRDLSSRISTSMGDHSMSATLRSPVLMDINRYELNASYGYSGERVSLGLDLNASDVFDRVGLGLSLSTSTVFADGLFAISSSIPSNYLLVRQKGALKGNTLSIGTAGAASSDYLQMTFGTGLYTGLSSNRGSSVMVYSTAEGDFGSTETVPVNIRNSEVKGYVLRIDADATYTVSGVVDIDNELWINNASPVYSVSLDDGAIALEATDYYLFTDSDGRFVLSDLPAGTYGFDVPLDDGWALLIFTVTEDLDNFRLVQVFDTLEMINLELPEPYSSSYIFTDMRQLTSDAFFEMLYPGFGEAA